MIRNLSEKQTRLAVKIEDWVERNRPAVATDHYNVEGARKMLAEAIALELPDIAYFQLLLQIERHKYGIEVS